MGIPFVNGYEALVTVFQEDLVRYEVLDVEGAVVLAGFARCVGDAHLIIMGQMTVYAAAHGIAPYDVSMVVHGGSA